MATKKAGSSTKAELPKLMKPEFVVVSSELRKANKWFDEQSKEVLADAMLVNRAKLRKGKPRLTDARLQRVIMAHERIQRMLNLLQKRHERLTERLKAHYGYTGTTEFESSLGKTLVSTSATFAVDPGELKLNLSFDGWKRLVEEVLKPELLLLAARDDMYLRSAILRATRVKELKVSVTAPSSRRGKSARADVEE